MKPEGGQTSPQKVPRKPKGRLITVGVILLLVLLGAARIYRPRFASSFPAHIGVEAPQFNDKETYQATISEANACSRIIAFFKHGALEVPCMCKEYARFSIYYKNGDVDRVDVLSGHSGPEFFQIRIGLCHYRLSRREFGRIIEEAGVDGSKLFTYEKLLYSEGAVAPKDQAEQVTPSLGDRP